MKKKKNIAVLIPCYNEEMTIKKVIKDFKKTLPEADIYVYDNNSTDNSKKLATSAGAIVKHEPKQGKGNVIRTMFKDIDADCYLIVDADDTYSAKDAKKMCDLILKDNYDMVVGDRLSSTYFIENKRRFHNIGNKIIRFLINKLFKSNITDITSGYRTLSYEFVKSYPSKAKGFEVETEMTIHAIDKNFKIKTLPILYKDRITGSISKLNTYKDGIVIVKTIIKLWKEFRPKQFFTTCSMIPLVISLLTGIPILNEYLKNKIISNIPHLIISMASLIISIILWTTGIILEVIHQKNNQLYELYFKNIRRNKNE